MKYLYFLVILVLLGCKTKCETCNGIGKLTCQGWSGSGKKDVVEVAK